ncbi:MAG: HAMP domain-containing protein, partial [Zoogloeaceae bacterium]|nr:HAMP domain-containing protein [Zoogloeaceae bacterium]
MNIKTRIVLLIIQALIGLIIVAVIGINNSKNDAELITDINENRIPRTIAMLKISSDVNDEVRRAYEILTKKGLPLNEQVEELKRILPLKQAIDKDIRENINVYENLSRSAEATKLFDKMKETMTTWSPVLVEGHTRLLEEGLASPTVEKLAAMYDKIQEGNMQMREKTPLLIEQIEEMLAYNKKRIAEDAAESEQSSNNALVLQIIIGVVFVVGIGFVGVSTLRAVVKPIEIVRDTTVRIASKNDLQARVDYHSSNEVGEMVEAFNGMLSKLQSSFQDITARVKEVND